MPDIFGWNFRLITYKLYLSLISIIPFNIFGVSNNAWMSIIAIHYACFFSLIIYLSKGKVNKTNAALGILVVMVNNKWSVLSADEVAAMISVLSVCYYDKFRPNLKFFIPIVSNAIFFIKGVSVFMFLPVLYIIFFDSKNAIVTTKKLIIPILMSFFVFVLIVSSTNEMQYLMTAKLFQNDSFIFWFGF
ncbi:hypothetical protein JCM19240_6057 [Vibrio maritimus]|uniref:Uncharacterized protein n=1 Tax=Vibrio maritimus TaxID=990268 RepID=A0A090SXX0_9VIBR|nr:hypothetical protein JCM19240_6057 [Vibrio maritimus]